MAFEEYLREQLARHPAMQPQDVVKLCYQAANGAEHLLSDPDRAKAYLEREYAETTACDGALYEQISDRTVRINLSAWKAKNLPLSWLFSMFFATCRQKNETGDTLAAYLQKADSVLTAVGADFSASQWKDYLLEYEKSGMPAVHHSERYRANEHPAYRIADSRFIRVIPILERIKDRAVGDPPCIIAIDGRAASGKTTLAGTLAIILDADVIHMDDFFVPPALRSEERFRIPGQNIHHERFCEEVLPHIAAKEGFSYRVFDCGVMDYNGKRQIGDKPFRIVEGSYSLHPIFGRYADITVLSDVSTEEQQARILHRNGAEMLARFAARWIPMEEAYFSHYAIADRADIRV